MGWLSFAWVALVVRVAVLTRPLVVPTTAVELVTGHGRRSDVDGPATGIGTVARESTPAAEPGRPWPGRRAGFAVVVTLVLGLVAAGSVPVAVAIVAAGGGGWWALRRRRARQRGVRVDRQLVLLVQLLDLGVGAGATIRLALAASAPRLGGEVGRAVGHATRRLANGMSLADALSELSAELDGRDRGVLAQVAAADSAGAPLGAVLGRAGRDLVEAERHRAALRARRLPVLLLVPLVACILPAFVVLAIVPMVAAGAGSLFPP